MGRKTRVSPDSAWPLRGADGLTYAERKAKEEAERPPNGSVAIAMEQELFMDNPIGAKP